MHIGTLTDLPAGEFQPLVAASRAEGLAFVARLVDEFADGRNRFDRPGEALYGAWRSGAIIGVCGCNIDPFGADPGIGRVRHLYVMPAERRSGVGRALVERVIRDARGRFRALSLRAPGAAAGAFYAALGFQPVGEPAATHFMVLPG